MKKILVVDDDKDLLVFVKSYLNKNGYDTRVTLSCDEGLDIFNSFEPDLVLLDVNVGSQDGREMCRSIRAQSINQHIPVILISADHHQLESYQQYGANAIIEKPFQLPALLELVQRII